jgi:hypothetical protein
VVPAVDNLQERAFAYRHKTLTAAGPLSASICRKAVIREIKHFA